jgi:hypothetical protein
MMNRLVLLLEILFLFVYFCGGLARCLLLLVGLLLFWVYSFFYFAPDCFWWVFAAALMCF